MSVYVANITFNLFTSGNLMNTFPQKNTKWLALTAGLTVAAVGAMSSTAQAATYSLNFDEGANGGDIQYNSNGALKLDQWQDSLGVTLNVNNNRNNSQGLLNTYNTDKSGRDNDLKTGSSYGTSKQGNVLIIQEELSANFSNGKYTADDEAAGGSIGFGFESKVAFNSFAMLDIDDNKDDHIRVTGSGTRDGQDFFLDIDIDALINGHRDAYNIGNVKDSNWKKKKAAKAAAVEAQGTSFTQDGVTITQVGTKRGDNSMYHFELDQTYFANMRLENIEFNYAGSGAIADINWSTDDAPGPQEIPEPSAIGGLLMIGFIGKKLKQKRDLALAGDLA